MAGKSNGLIARLLNRWPLAKRSTLDAAIVMLAREQDERRRDRIKHEKDLDNRADDVCYIIDKCSDIDWTRDGERYEIRMTFDPRMFGDCNVDQIDMLASVFSRMVYREIATARFIQKANDNRRRTMERPVNPDYERS